MDFSLSELDSRLRRKKSSMPKALLPIVYDSDETESPDSDAYTRCEIAAEEARKFFADRGPLRNYYETESDAESQPAPRFGFAFNGAPLANFKGPEESRGPHEPLFSIESRAYIMETWSEAKRRRAASSIERRNEAISAHYNIMTRTRGPHTPIFLTKPAFCYDTDSDEAETIKSKTVSRKPKQRATSSKAAPTLTYLPPGALFHQPLRRSQRLTEKDAQASLKRTQEAKVKKRKGTQKAAVKRRKGA